MGATRTELAELMTAAPACCMPETPLREVAQLLIEHDCGAIPVIESRDTGKPIGIVTDRDIACRTVAAGQNPLDLTAADCMSSPCVTATPDTTLDECCRLMEGNRIRRIVIVDEDGAACGIVAQADVALHAGDERAAEVLRKVSLPTDAPSAV